MTDPPHEPPRVPEPGTAPMKCAALSAVLMAALPEHDAAPQGLGAGLPWKTRVTGDGGQLLLWLVGEYVPVPGRAGKLTEQWYLPVVDGGHPGQWTP